MRNIRGTRLRGWRLHSVLVVLILGTPAAGLAWKGGRETPNPPVIGVILEVNASSRAIVIRDTKGVTQTFQVGPRTEIEVEREVSRGVRMIRAGGFEDLVPGAWIRARLGEGDSSTARTVILLPSVQATPLAAGK